MAETILVLFISIFIPLTMGLFLIKGRARTTVLFMIVGLFVCLFAAYINGFIAAHSGLTVVQLTFTVTPIVEEIMKAVPLILFAFMFQPKKNHLLACATMTGIGFAVLENAYILATNIETITIGWAIIRGLGAGLMHGVCTMLVGYGLYYINKIRKMAITGTYALLMLAIVYHACYNMLIQSEYKLCGIILPIITLLPILFIRYHVGKNKASQPPKKDITETEGALQ